jgi:hypothetical protein
MLAAGHWSDLNLRLGFGEAAIGGRQSIKIKCATHFEGDGDGLGWHDGPEATGTNNLAAIANQNREMLRRPPQLVGYGGRLNSIGRYNELLKLSR